MKNLKTFLRYPGGKSRAIDKMFKYLPDMTNYDEFREPFLGGGSVSIAMTKRYPNMNIWVNDLYEPLYNLYTQLQKDGDNLYTEIRNLKLENNTFDKIKVVFAGFKTKIYDHTASDFDRAVAFYVLNRCSFSGLNENGTATEWACTKNFNLSSIDKLPAFSRIIKDWKITNLSYEQLMIEDPKAFVYLDPPYDIKTKIYGKGGSMHRGFAHDDFATLCNKTNIDMMISYNADQCVQERFGDTKWKAVVFDHTYTMKSVGDYMENQKDRKELLLINYEPCEYRGL